MTPLLSTGQKMVLTWIIFSLLAVTKGLSGAKPGKLLLLAFGISVGVANDIGEWPWVSLDAMALHVYFLSGIVTAWALASIIGVDNFYEEIGRVGVWLAGLSVVGVAIYSLFPQLIAMLPAYEYYDSSHRTALFANFLISPDGAVIQRNAGVASEPGLFQVVLNLTAVAIYRKGTLEGKNLAQLAIVAVALFTTGSTAGLVAFAIVLACLGIRHKKAIPLIAASVAVLWGAVSSEVEHQLENKLVGSAAFDGRRDPTLAILARVPSSPLGVGNSFYSANYDDLGWGSYDSYTQILIRYGVPLALIITGCLLGTASKMPLTVLVLAVTMLSQPIWFTPLVAYFYFADVTVNRVSPTRKEFRTESFVDNQHRSSALLSRHRGSTYSPR